MISSSSDIEWEVLGRKVSLICIPKRTKNLFDIPQK